MRETERQRNIGSVNQYRRDKVRLGIEAPKTVRVIREELTAEIGQEHRMAAQSSYFPFCQK
jgi:carbon storage regulator CsrA